MTRPTQLRLLLEDRRVDRLSCLAGLPLGWDRSHPAYVRYGLGPILNVPRYTIYSLRAGDRIG